MCRVEMVQVETEDRTLWDTKLDHLRATREVRFEPGVHKDQR